MAKESNRKRKEHFDAPVGLPLDRQMPHNLEAERGVVGAMILKPTVCDDLAVILRPDDFYSDSNRRIYRHLLAMNGDASAIDLTLLVERLRQSGELEQIGGEAYLAELMTSVQVAAHAERYAEIVRDKAILRNLIEASSSILGDAYEPEKQPRELVSQAEERIFAIGDSRNSSRLFDMRTILDDVNKLLESRTGDMGGIPTGFTNLDAMLGGFHASELLILAARPSMGKTALATNIADYVAVENRQPVLFFSLEMSRTELAFRMLCSRGRIPLKQLRENFLSAGARNRFLEASSELCDSPLYVDDSPARTVTEIGAVARRMKRQNQSLGLIVIDYLGLIEPENADDPRQEQVAKIARRLKGLARELDVPVLCLAQLNRMAEESKDKRPRLNHLRESGAIEQDADVVMFVHRDEYYMTGEKANDENKKGEALVIVAKQRNGPVGDVKLNWDAEYTRFRNYGEEYAEEHEEFNNFGSGEFAKDF